jgi:hypothetical protein
MTAEGPQRNYMQRYALGLICLFAAFGNAQAESAPSELLGKSVVVTWSENRTQKVGDDPTMRNMNIGFTSSIYISSAGRAFRRTSVQSPRAAGSREQVGSGGATSSGGAAELQFQGRSIVSMGAHGGGARRTIIDFDESYGSCSAKVALAKEAGSGGPIRMTSIASGKRLEIHAVSIGGVSCSVRNGNIFGN